MGVASFEGDCWTMYYYAVMFPIEMLNSGVQKSYTNGPAGLRGEFIDTRVRTHGKSIGHAQRDFLQN